MSMPLPPNYMGGNPLNNLLSMLTGDTNAQDSGIDPTQQAAESRLAQMSDPMAAANYKYASTAGGPLSASTSGEMSGNLGQLMGVVNSSPVDNYRDTAIRDRMLSGKKASPSKTPGR